MAKCANLNGAWAVITIAWTADNRKSALVGVDLSSMQPAVVLQEEVKNKYQLFKQI